MDGSLINLDFYATIKVVRVTYGGSNAPVARWEIRAYRADNDKYGKVLDQAAAEAEALEKCESLYAKLTAGA